MTDSSNIPWKDSNLKEEWTSQLVNFPQSLTLLVLVGRGVLTEYGLKIELVFLYTEASCHNISNT